MDSAMMGGSVSGGGWVEPHEQVMDDKSRAHGLAPIGNADMMYADEGDPDGGDDGSGGQRDSYLDLDMTKHELLACSYGRIAMAATT